VNERVQRFDDRIVKQRAWPHERAMMAAAAAAGCAPQFEVTGRDEITMPRLEVLKDRLETASPADRRRVAHAVLACLERLHASGICHRDAHCENVVLDGARALLVDFELACDVDPGRPCYDLLGPTSGVPVPWQHEWLGIRDGVWWDSSAAQVRQLWQDLGRLEDMRSFEPKSG
jgi:hypothetical protein